MDKLFGRAQGIKELNFATSYGQSAFVAIYGRRRVGKTFLVREYFGDKFEFQLTGLANANTHQQLLNFHTAMQQQFPDYEKDIPTRWLEAFHYLEVALSKRKGSHQKVVFLDELPWMDTARSDFLSGLESFWNGWASARSDIVLVTCGSAVPWMLKRLIRNRGGLYGRVTHRIRVEPFNLQEAELMLQSRNVRLDRFQTLQLYMAIGGIPHYLNMVKPGKSADQIIEELCFQKGGPLSREFPNLFASLFKKPEKYEAIMVALSQKSKGISRTEIAKKAKISSGGGLSRRLEELEANGFITRYIPFNRKSRDVLYRLSDFYSAFYLKFLKEGPAKPMGNWLNAVNHPRHRNWAGFAFEQVCLEHILQIESALGISGVYTEASTWRSKENKKGAQIDLVLDRADQVINLFEFRYSTRPYTITKAYDLKLRNREETFRRETKTRKALYLTSLTTHDLTPNGYQYIFMNQLTMGILFK